MENEIHPSWKEEVFKIVMQRFRSNYILRSKSVLIVFNIIWNLRIAYMNN